MLDNNGKLIVQGQFLKVTGCKTKGDNSIYIVDKQYEKGDYCLLKVTQTGDISKSKYNIFFLDEKHDTAKQVTIIEQNQLKQAAKEVKKYVNGLTANEMVYTFIKTEEQEIQIGLYVNFLKSALLRGHINSISGMYEIENVTAEGKVQLHLMGKKGERIADNINGYYQFQPITLYFNANVMQQLFTENYIEIMARTVAVKGDIINHNVSTEAIETALEEVTEPIEIIEAESIETPKQQDEETEQKHKQL